MPTKDQKFIPHWENQIQKGKVYFMLTRGIAWGVIAAVVSTLFRLGDSSVSELYLSGAFLIKLLVMIAVGVLFQRWQWSYNNSKYDKLRNEQTNSLSNNHTSNL